MQSVGLMATPNKTEKRARLPVVVIMGHIDHGKSTLLDYIRKQNTVSGEAGGITQKVSAYETSGITFLDTPGHEAFVSTRAHGAGAADIAILVVSAEDGVMPQTKEAFLATQKNNMPVVIAINKIDSPKANIAKAKQTLAENNILIEEYGGKFPCIEISAKTGQGVPELLEMIKIVAEMDQLTSNDSSPASGFIVECNRDPKCGISATMILKDGTLKNGMFVATKKAWAPVRFIENTFGKNIDEAKAPMPVVIYGWSEIPGQGQEFFSFDDKKEMEKFIEELKSLDKDESDEVENREGVFVIPLIIRADLQGTIDAIKYEIKKIENEKVRFSIIDADVGTISETDAKHASSKQETVIVGFNTIIEKQAKAIIERSPFAYATFTVIYDLIDWLKKIVLERTPKQTIKEKTGSAKIIRKFNNDKSRQVIGAKVVEGVIKKGEALEIMRRGEKIGMGNIKEIQKNKAATSSVDQGDEFGMAVESKIELAEGDIVEQFTEKII